MPPATITLLTLQGGEETAALLTALQQTLVDEARVLYPDGLPLDTREPDTPVVIEFADGRRRRSAAQTVRLALSEIRLDWNELVQFAEDY